VLYILDVVIGGWGLGQHLL